MDSKGRQRFCAGDGISPSIGAHRGGAAYVPENTMLAFEHAVATGVHSVEVDVRRTADGDLVVAHDDDLGRTTPAEGRIGTTSTAQLLTLDAAHWFSPGQPVTAPDPDRAHPLRDHGVRIPLLVDVLDRWAELGTDGPVLCLEVKETFSDSAFDATGRLTIEKVVAMVAARGLLDRVTVLSFWPPVIDHAKHLEPAVVTHLLTTSQLGATFADNLAHVIEFDHDVISVDIATSDLTPESVSEAHAAGKAVVPYTADLHADLDRMSELGVDGVFSDVPQCLAERTGREPADATAPALAALGIEVARCLDEA